MCRYAEAKWGREHAFYMLLHGSICTIIMTPAFNVFFYGTKIVTAVCKFYRQKKSRGAKIMQHILGAQGPDRLLELLPYINGYKMAPIAA